MVRASQWGNREDMLWCSCLLLLVLSGVATAQEGKRTVAVTMDPIYAVTRVGPLASYVRRTGENH